MRRLPSLKAWQKPGEQRPAHRLSNLGPGVRPPRALRTLAHEAVVAEGGPHPPVKGGANGATVWRVILADRATSVPFTAVLNGPERTTTDNDEPASTCTIPRPCRSRQRPI
jgi:hypothetical protein